MFLDKKETLSKIREVILEDEDPLIAVAYWGDRAIESLGIDKASKNIDIVCSLRAGATNPDVIEKLLSLEHIRIRHLDGLHSKLYLSKSRAIIGSSNASSNGLSLSDSEIHSSMNDAWFEANYLFTKDSHVQNARNWFRGVWEKSHLITDSDISKAKSQWKLKRKNRYAAILQSNDDEWSLSRLRESRSLLEDREIFVIHQVWGESPNASKLAKQELRERRIPAASIEKDYNWTYEIGKDSNTRYDPNAVYIFLTTGPKGGGLEIEIAKFIEEPHVRVKNTSVWIYMVKDNILLDSENRFSLSSEVAKAIGKGKKTIISAIEEKGGQMALMDLVDYL